MLLSALVVTKCNKGGLSCSYSVTTEKNMRTVFFFFFYLPQNMEKQTKVTAQFAVQRLY